jgi:hypothetical protein
MLLVLRESASSYGTSGLERSELSQGTESVRGMPAQRSAGSRGDTPRSEHMDPKATQISSWPSGGMRLPRPRKGLNMPNSGTLEQKQLMVLVQLRKQVDCFEEWCLGREEAFLSGVRMEGCPIPFCLSLTLHGSITQSDVGRFCKKP